jgi:hypothetical protein
MLIETDWLNVLLVENKGYIIQAAQVWFCCHMPGQLGIGFVDGYAEINESLWTKKGYMLRLAWELPAFLVDEEGYDFEALGWPWTIADILFMNIPCVSVVKHYW